MARRFLEGLGWLECCWRVLGGSGGFSEGPGLSGRVWEGPGGSTMEDLGGSVRFWEGLRWLEASWRVQEGQGGSRIFRRILEGPDVSGRVQDS